MIAVYGGSLSPITLAHEQIIRSLAETYKVIIIPVGDKYKKDELLPSKDRLNMIKCLDFNKNVSISTIEIDSKDILNTYETLNILKKENPNEELKFIIGTDNLIDFPNWDNAREILDEFGLIVIKRDSLDFNSIINNNQLLLNYVHNIVDIDLNIETGISSTKLRTLLKKENYNMEELSKYINDKVLSYILKNKLFK